MKKIILILVVALFVSSCGSFLEQENPNQVTSSTFFQTEDDFEQGLIAAYVPFRNPGGGYYNVTAIKIRNIRSDELVTRNDEESIYQLSLFTNNPDASSVQEMFVENYSAIYRANTLIDKIQESDLKQEFKDDILGQALFIRGVNYIALATEFKDIPLRLIASQKPENYNLAKSSQQDVYNQIESDLKRAAELLPVEAVDNGRTTKGAALAYLGKLYIYEDRWADAIEVLEPLTSSPYTYALVDYAQNFDLDRECNLNSVQFFVNE